MFSNAKAFADSFHRVLVVGTGAREHALVCKCADSPQVSHVYAYPGNDGMVFKPTTSSDAVIQRVVLPTELKTTHTTVLTALIAYAHDHRIDMVVIGPETELAKGWSDAFQDAGVPCFGPRQHASQIESSKAFSKRLMQTLHLPTAPFRIFGPDQHDDAQSYLASLAPPLAPPSLAPPPLAPSRTTSAEPCPIVVKASGLVGGKGVVLPDTLDDASDIVRQMMSGELCGSAGHTVVIEERLVGEEVSVMAFCNGREAHLMPQAQDYKRIGDNDTGLNTGGMGAIAPVAVLTAEECTQVKTYMDRVVQELSYIGVLYAGLMKTKNGVFVLEFNCRFGDPEAQVVLPLLDGDMYTVMDHCVRQQAVTLKWHSGTVSNVVLSHMEYPGGKRLEACPITFLDTANNSDRLHCDLYFGNVQQDTDAADTTLYTTGGRVMSVVCHADTAWSSLTHIYNWIPSAVHYDQMYYRRDIGYRTLTPLTIPPPPPPPSSPPSLPGPRIRIAILGSTRGTSAHPLFTYASSPQCPVTIGLVLSNRAKAPLLDVARDHLIPYMFLSAKQAKDATAYDRNIRTLLCMHQIDYVFLVGYMKRVTPVLIEAYPNRIFNIHPSLLPAHKGKMGPAIHHDVLEAKEPVTGCTLHVVDEGMDTGPIQMQRQLRVPNECTEDQLKTMVQALESQVIVEFVTILAHLHTTDTNIPNTSITYKDAGVNIHAGDTFVHYIQSHIAPQIGGFSGLFEVDGVTLAATTDGVGTKLEIAQMLHTYDTIGIDLVAMCVNDLLAQGAKPLVFLDYIAVDTLDHEKCCVLIQGVKDGCVRGQCQLIGGETAEMPGIYPAGGFDMAGFAIGQCHWTPSRPVQAGDRLFGVPSSGVHSNGYSLIRKLLTTTGVTVNAPSIGSIASNTPLTDGLCMADLLTPTRIYVEDVAYAFDHCDALAIAHITGGGLLGNVPRVLPDGLTFEWTSTWTFPRVFQWIQETAQLSRDEMMGTFNCGFGLVVVVPAGGGVDGGGISGEWVELGRVVVEG